MAPLLTASDIRLRFDIDTVIRDDRITPHIASASSMLKTWIGAGRYQSAVDDTGETLDSTPIIKNAEAHLTMYFAIPGLNTPIGTKGLWITAKESAGSSTFTKPNAQEIRGLIRQFLTAAREMVEPYLLPNAPPIPGRSSARTVTATTQRVETDQMDVTENLRFGTEKSVRRFARRLRWLG